MKIESTSIPIYGILIILSLVVGMIYIYKNMEKEERKNLYLYFLLYLSFALVFGKLFTMITSKGEVDIIHVGVSSLGGVIGTILSAYIYEKIEDHQNKVIKYTILSLPLVYSISKIGCFIVGCCYGIPYNGFGSVIYPDGLNENLFPIQLVEVISFFLLFMILHKIKDNKNSIPITLITSSLLKFFLDFLRYDHVTKIITLNQIVCIIIVVITVIYMWKRGIKSDNRRVKRTTNS